jgi:hypothetical protein
MRQGNMSLINKNSAANDLNLNCIDDTFELLSGLSTKENIIKPKKRKMDEWLKVIKIGEKLVKKVEFAPHIEKESRSESLFSEA